MTFPVIGPAQAQVMIVGEFPAASDYRLNEPFSGGIGFELSKMLGEAGLSKDHCICTYVVNERVPSQSLDYLIAPKKTSITPSHSLWKGKWVTQVFLDGVENLRELILKRRPNVVVAAGDLALFALTGEWSVTNWRSSIMESTLVPGVKVIPTYAPAMVCAVASLRPIAVHDFKRIAAHKDKPEVKRLPYNFRVSPTFKEAVDTLQWVIAMCEDHQLKTGQRMKVGGDIETRAGHISCIAFAWSNLDALCIPLMCQHNDEGYWSLEEETTLVLLMLHLMRVCTIVGQNWNYDAQYIYRHWHFLCPSVVDTMIEHHSCFSHLEKNLAFLSSMYLDDHFYWKDDRTNWDSGSKGEGEVVYWRYNCTDAARTYAIDGVLTGVIKALGMGEVNAFQQKLATKVLKSMNKGVRLDREAQGQLSMTIQEEVATREAWLADVTGDILNIRSPVQMKDFFYRQMGQKEVISRKTKNVTCDDEALHKIASREPVLLPVTRKIAELRSLGVFHKTFVLAAADIDGRIRTSFNVCGTETYRFSSTKNAFGSGLNMQNIPKGGETEDDGLELPNVRKLYIPDDNMTMFDIDLDSADLRIVTWESGCDWMKDHFRNGRKPYVEVMREYYHNPSMDKKSNPREYAMFKSLCHGTNYLGTADGIAPRIGLLVHETERIQKWYFGLAPEIRKWQEDIKKQVSSRRFVQNVFGYRTYFFDRIEGTVFNQAVAWIPQSTVACLINRAYVKIDDELPDVDVLLQVHDSLVGQVPSHNAEQHLDAIVKCSEIPLPYAEPLIIPVGIASSSKSWGDCR
jgi:DNA polymerase I-like protein with 3'-5' exonuclease and polymerase domains/uracil-DNA glycosylase